tara:strand:- start:8828 stop:11410 length:2583 start_codon:yes stop_codon:yes gene_type:complete
MSYFNIIDECILRYKDNVDKINDKGFEAESCSDLNGYLIKEIEENDIKQATFEYKTHIEQGNDVYFVFGNDYQKESLIKLRIFSGENTIKIDLRKKRITGVSGNAHVDRPIVKNIRSIKYFGFLMVKSSMDCSLPEINLRKLPLRKALSKRPSPLQKPPLVCLLTKNSEKEISEQLKKIEQEFSKTSYGLIIADLNSEDSTYDIIKSYNSTAEFYHYLQFNHSSLTNAKERIEEFVKSFDAAFLPYVVYKDITLKENKHNIKSFCTVATENCKVEASVLLKSLRCFHTEPVYVICDSDTEKFLTIEGFDNVHYKPVMPKDKLAKIKKELFSDLFYVKKQFHKPECILHKMDAMDFALEHHENTFFLDSDVIVIDSLQENFYKDIVLSPHFYTRENVEDSFKYGVFNAGYIFCADKSFPSHWKNIYLNRSTFFEQEGLNHVLEDYDIQTFSKLHNFGFWSKHDPDINTKSFHVHTIEESFNGIEKLQKSNERTKKILLKHLYKIGRKDLSKYIAYSKGKDWGGMDTNLNITHANQSGKINISNQQVFWHHRSGWNYAIQSLSSLHNQDGVLFDGFLEKNFGWWYEDNLANNRLPYTAPWVGFFHNPPNIPPWFFYENSIQEIISKPAVKESFENCLGIFALSEYHAEWLRDVLGKPVSVLFHPSEIPKNIFSFDEFINNDDKKIVNIGYWLRKLNSIYQLPIKKSDKLTKARLIPYNKKSPKSKIEQLIAIEKQEQGIEIDPEYEQNTVSLERLPDEEYDNLLTNNIAFLDLYDSSANNAIIECLARATPILVNPLPAVVEYLGKDYPFYFNDLNEAAEKAKDFNLIKDTHEFMLNCENRKKLSGGFFKKELEKSEVYNLL